MIALRTLIVKHFFKIFFKTAEKRCCLATALSIYHLFRLLSIGLFIQFSVCLLPHFRAFPYILYNSGKLFSDPHHISNFNIWRIMCDFFAVNVKVPWKKHFLIRWFYWQLIYFASIIYAYEYVQLSLFNFSYFI